MILKQYYLGCLAHASYLLGDEASSTAIVVDQLASVEGICSDCECEISRKLELSCVHTRR